MKFTKVFLAALFIFTASSVRADTYTTDCTIEVKAQKTYGRSRNVGTYTLDSKVFKEVTPERCLISAIAFAKDFRPKNIGGSDIYRNSNSYFNIATEVKITQKDNVTFPKKDLEQKIDSEQCVTLKKAFELERGEWFDSDDYYVGVIKKKEDC